MTNIILKEEPIEQFIKEGIEHGLIEPFEVIDFLINNSDMNRDDYGLLELAIKNYN